MIDLRKLEKDVIELSGEVANFIGNEVKGFDKNKIEHKDTSNNLVSYVDKEAEKIGQGFEGHFARCRFPG